MAEAVYLLCALTSFICAVLLLRAYARTGFRLMLWAGLCFVGLTTDNVVLFVDLVVFPTIDLSIWRNVCAVVSVLLLLYGLIFESD